MRLTLTLIITLVTMLVAESARAALMLYDDFNNATLSDSLWSKDTGGIGSVTFNGSTGVMSAPSGTAPKWASIRPTFRPNLVSNGDFFRMSWDQSISGTLTSAYRMGAAFFPSSNDTSASLLQAGQFGQGGTATQDLEFLLGESAIEITSNINPSSGTLYHYDVTLTLSDSGLGTVDSSLRVYSYEAALDTTPETYFTSRTPLATLTESHNWLDTTDLLVAYGPTFFGSNTNTANAARGDLTVDNVFVFVTPQVPEPSSLLLLGFGCMLLSRRRVPRRAPTPGQPAFRS